MGNKRVKIVILDGNRVNPGDNPWDRVAALGDLSIFDRSAPEEILDRCQGADIVLTNKTPLTRDTIDSLSGLKFISVLATGYNIVDVDAARDRNIPVSNVPVYGTNAVSQFVFALMLELCHHAGLHHQVVVEGEWTNSVHWSYWKTPLFELSGKTMGIIGFGRIGRRVGEIAHAFGMPVLAADLFPDNPPAYKPFAFVENEEVFRRADVVSLNCSLTPENEGLVDQHLLSLMKKKALLINASRGQLVNEQDLADALNSGVIAGAALDVVSTEPIKPDNPLLKASNCIITPHIAWAALEARQRIVLTTAQNIEAFLAGEPQNIVNEAREEQ